ALLLPDGERLPAGQEDRRVHRDPRADGHPPARPRLLPDEHHPEPDERRVDARPGHGPVPQGVGGFPPAPPQPARLPPPHRSAAWPAPEMYDYALQALIPDPASFAPYQQWYTFQRIISYSGDGKVNSMVSQLLDMATAQSKLDELSARVDDAMKKLPPWKA